MPLANYLKGASLETGGGHGTLMVDAGAMLPRGQLSRADAGRRSMARSSTSSSRPARASN